MGAFPSSTTVVVDEDEVVEGGEALTFGGRDPMDCLSSSPLCLDEVRWVFLFCTYFTFSSPLAVCCDTDSGSPIFAVARH